MTIEVNTGLTDLIEELSSKVDEGTVAARTTNLLLLAQAMGGLDATEPVQAQKVLRHLRTVESAVKSDVA